MESTDFKFKHKISIRWRDMDEFNHVNPSVYLSFIEQARFHFLEKELNWDWDKYNFLTTQAVVDYKIPLLLTDKPYIWVCCKQVNDNGFVLQYKIVVERDGQQKTASLCETTMQMFDHKQEKNLSMPNELKEKFAAYNNDTNMVT